MDQIITSATVAEFLNNINNMEDNQQQTQAAEIQQPAEKEFKAVDSTKWPLVNEEGRKLSRRFLGNIFGRKKERKEFQAYLKGASVYVYERDRFPVRQEFFYV